MAGQTYYTRRQMLALLHGWGYTQGTLPQRHRPESTVSIAPAMRTGTQTRATITYGPTNGVGQRLYGVTFIN